MTTDAKIATPEADAAVLSLEGKTLIARLLTGGKFTVESAGQEMPQKKTAGVKRLTVRLPRAAGRVSVAVLLSPVWPDGGAVKSAELKALGAW